MREAAPPLLPVFRSQTQGELLALILGGADRAWTIEELADRTGRPYQTVTGEIRRLETAAIVTVETVGRTKLIRANAESPYTAPLTQLAVMSFGPPVVIAEEFGSVWRIERLYLYGSWAARHAGEIGPPPNDIDVLVVGQPDRDDVYDAAQRAQQRLGREVNVTLRTARAWSTADDAFTRQVKASPLLEVPYPASDDAVGRRKRVDRTAPRRGAPPSRRPQP